MRAEIEIPDSWTASQMAPAPGCIVVRLRSTADGKVIAEPVPQGHRHNRRPQHQSTPPEAA